MCQQIRKEKEIERLDEDTVNYLYLIFNLAFGIIKKQIIHVDNSLG
jgi:hypothetical protein